MNEEMIVIQDGAPENLKDRLARETRCYDALEKLGIKYKRADHGAAHTMEDCVAVEKALGVKIPKNLLLCNRQMTDFYLLMLPSDKVFKTKDISAQLGTARLSFATHEFMEQFLDTEPGSLSILGLMNDKDSRVRLVIDEEVLGESLIGCHPCINTSTLAISRDDLLEKFVSSVGHTVTTVTLPDRSNEE